MGIFQLFFKSLLSLILTRYTWRKSSISSVINYTSSGKEIISYGKHLILAHSEFLTTLQVYVELVDLPPGKEVNSSVTESTTNVTFTIGIIFYCKER